MGSDPGTEQRIREAALRALAKHGYADLSINDIGAELATDPSLIYHYFDSKDDLLRSMLDAFVEMYIESQESRPVADAAAELRRFVEQTLHPKPSHFEWAGTASQADLEAMSGPLFVELWAHAMRNDELRAKTTQVDALTRQSLAGIIERGIETGQFRPVDPERTADHIHMLVKQGIHTRATTNEQDADERAKSLIDGVIADISLDD